MSLKHVSIVGGTHGNEWGGIYLHELWHDRPDLFAHYPFEVELYLGNPEATTLNRRYVDQDLNRSFGKGKQKGYESQRAKEMRKTLADTDLLIDLHNTTSQMGKSLILSAEQPFSDPFMRQLCAHLSQDPDVYIYHMPHKNADNPHLPGLVERNITLEVGPMAHGTLMAEPFFAMQHTVQQILDYSADWERGEARTYSGKLCVYTHLEHLDYPRRPDGKLRAMIHPQRQGQDYQAMKPGEPLFVSFTGEDLPYEGDTEVWPVFINEQAYYEKGIAMALTRRQLVDLESGRY